jgi:hypothetical protein
MYIQALISALISASLIFRISGKNYHTSGFSRKQLSYFREDFFVAEACISGKIQLIEYVSRSRKKLSQRCWNYQ